MNRFLVRKDVLHRRPPNRVLWGFPRAGQQGRKRSLSPTAWISPLRQLEPPPSSDPDFAGLGWCDPSCKVATEAGEFGQAGISPEVSRSAPPRGPERPEMRVNSATLLCPALQSGLRGGALSPGREGLALYPSALGTHLPGGSRLSELCHRFLWSVSSLLGTQDPSRAGKCAARQLFLAALGFSPPPEIVGSQRLCPILCNLGSAGTADLLLGGLGQRPTSRARRAVIPHRASLEIPTA